MTVQSLPLLRSRWISLALFLFIISLLAACGQNSAAAPENQSPTESAESVAGPGTGQTPEAYVFTESEIGYATIHGTLVLVDPMTFLPAEDGIYLVPTDPESDGYLIPPLEEDFPRGDVDEITGEFVVANVSTGHYALVVQSKSGSTFPIRDLATAELVRIQVSEEDLDQTLEVGQVRVP